MHVRASSTTVSPSQTVLMAGNVMPSEPENWERSAKREVSITETQKKFGWAGGSGQADLLRAASRLWPLKVT